MLRKNIPARYLSIFFSVLILFILTEPGCFKQADGTVRILSPLCLSAAEEPPFIKEGELTFLDRTGKKIIAAIDIEIADTDYERTRGLMNRHSLPENAGMLFIFERPEPRSFWMRNTYIPLDIIFADGNQKVVTIQRRTEPLSYDAVQSKHDAKYVVEVNAGFCDKYGIAVGNYIKFKRGRQ